MKRNIYSYSKLWMIFFVLMGAACTNQVEDAIPVSGQPIEFSVQSDWKEIPNTRLNDGKMNFYAKDTIQIFGFHKPSSGDEKKLKKFMYRVGDSHRGQKVVYDGKDWNYSPKHFWPKEGKLDFYASYPEYSVLNEEDKMTYVQPNFNPLGVDLLWGLATNRDCATVRKKPVQIWMVHALAKVNIFLTALWVTSSKLKSRLTKQAISLTPPIMESLFGMLKRILFKLPFLKNRRKLVMLPYLSCQIGLRDSN